MNRFRTHHQQPTDSSRMMDLIAGSFDILVRRVHKRKKPPKKLNIKTFKNSIQLQSSSAPLSSRMDPHHHNFQQILKYSLLKLALFALSTRLSKLPVHFLWPKTSQEFRFSCILRPLFTVKINEHDFFQLRMTRAMIT